jgi:disulfide bond formation protein DsbB
MPVYVEIVNKILSLGIIFLQILILLIALNFIFNYKNENKILFFIKKYTFHLGFLVALGSIFCSLFYSEIAGFPPCDLCWIQRIFLYPQLILFGFGLYKKDKSILNYSLVLAILGSIVSIYHIFVENGLTTSVLCGDPSGGGVSCSARYIYEFGYITMPIMALTLSLFIITLVLNYKYYSKK